MPKWARRTKSLDALLPALYLRGISAGDFQEVLTALLGKDAPNLSPAVIARLKGEWEDEYQGWQKRDLSARRYVYVWADGVYLQARMEPQAECMLVLIGATPEGRGVDRFPDRHAGERTELEGIARRFEGARLVDRTGSRRWRWRARLLESSRRDLPFYVSPTLLAAQDVERSRQVSKVHATQRAQRPARNLAGAGSSNGETAIATFAEKYAPKYDKAVECLIKDRETLLTFFDFPADHWDHLRTTNPIESVFATVRHRTVRMKGALSQATARLMVFKLVMVAAKTWRRLQGQNQLPKVIKGVKFRDGIEVAPETKSAA